MLLVRALRAGRPSGELTALSLVRDLRPSLEEAWSERSFQDGSVTWCSGPGMRPHVTFTEEGDWLAAVGTPSGSRRGVAPTEAELAGWLAELCQGSIKGLTDCEGLFAFVGYDGARRQLHVVMDRTGLFPIYLSQDAGGLWLSTSSLAIARLRPTTVSMDFLACMQHVGFPLGTVSLFSEVEALGPGLHLVYHGGRIERRTWWRPPPVDVPGRSVREYADELAAIGQQAVLRLQDSDIWCALTAGLDSRCLCALLSRAQFPVRYFTGPTATMLDERRGAELAAHLSLDWRILEDEPTAVDVQRSHWIDIVYSSDAELEPSSGYGSWSRRLSGARVVTLWGFGGEVHRDYWSAHERFGFLLKGRDRLERLLNWRCTGVRFAQEALLPEYRDDSRARALALLRACDAQHSDAGSLDRLERLYTHERMRRWAGLHARVIGRWTTPELPLFNQRAVELAYRLPACARRHGQLHRWLIWQCLPAAAALPINAGYTALPDAHAPRSARATELWLSGQRFATAIRRKFGRTKRPARAVTGPTFRDIAEDLLDVRHMRSAYLFHEDGLKQYVRDLLDRPVEFTSGYLVALELALRIAAQPG